MILVVCKGKIRVFKGEYFWIFVLEVVSFVILIVFFFRRWSGSVLFERSR